MKMMKKLVCLTTAAASVAAIVVLTGCAGLSQSPVSGTLYTGVQGHSNATSNPVGTKRGESCAMSILGIIAIGDASATTAAQAGGITKIGVVDTDMFGVLGLYAKHCTVVKGE
jgi:hypothetical protein